MKVLYITNSVEMGGASVALINMLEYLIKYDIKPLVTCPEQGTFSDKLDEMGIPFVVIENQLEIYPTIYSWKSYIKYPYSLFKMIEKRNNAYKRIRSCVENFKPDIIHTNVGPIHIGYKVAKEYKIPHVWHIREYQKEDFNMHPFPSMNIFRKRIHDKHNHCICITKNIFDHFQLDSTKDKVIYDGVINEKQIKPLNKNKKSYILFVGRLEDAKGIKDLIKDFIIYKNKGGRKELKIAGSGSEQYIKECKSLIPHNLENVIEFLGQRTDVFDLMYNASLLVVPSRNEGFGFITAEAMFNGTIVIGKNTGGTKEQFDNGVKLNRKEIAYRYISDNELISQLLKLDTENDYNKLILAQQTVCSLYDKHKQSLKILSFYKKILYEKNNNYYN